MHSLKAFAQSTLVELKDALVDAVGDDEDEDEDFTGGLPAQTLQAEGASELREDLGGDPIETFSVSAINGEASANTLAQSKESAESEATKLEFRAVRDSPYLESCLTEMDSDKATRAGEWNKDDLSVPEIAALSCWTLRQLLPLAAPASRTAEAPSETQRLLRSFSDRYDVLLSEHSALQQRTRELSIANSELSRSAQQAESWKSAHGAAIARLEELSSENADLKERIRSQKDAINQIRSEEHQLSKNQLAEKLEQKDAEIQALAGAMERLQEVVDDQSSLMIKCSNLERKLEEAKQAKELEKPTSDELLHTQTGNVRKETHETAEGRQLLARCLHAEKELSETSAALEVLLEEKSRRLEDQEHLVDRRLVTSMLALYHDHVASGQRTLADQVLTQALHILGGVPEETQKSRQQVRAAAAAAEARLAEPLGNAFLDFLEKEAETEMEMARGRRGAATAEGAVLAGADAVGKLAVPNGNTVPQLPPFAPPEVPLPLPK